MNDYLKIEKNSNFVEERERERERGRIGCKCVIYVGVCGDE